MEGEDLQQKYAKLLQAYADLKAKNGVLKKALVEAEQQQQQQPAQPPQRPQPPQPQLDELQRLVARLQAQLSDKDQKLRDAVQQLDTAAFRSQQLAKRVEVLQEELEKVSKSSGSSKARKAAAVKQEETMALQEEELRRMIEENGRLHEAMREMENRQKRDTEHAQAELLELQNAAHQTQADMQRRLDAYATTIKTVTAERDEAVAEMQRVRSQLETEQARAIQTQQEVEAEKERLQAQILHTKLALEQKISFDDTKQRPLLQYNLTMPQPTGVQALSRFFTDLNDVVSTAVVHWGSFLTYAEDRARLLGQAHNLPADVVNAYAQHLHLHGEALKPIPGAVAELGQRVEAAQPAQGLAVLLQALDQLAQYFGTLSQHEQAFVQQESNAPNCPPSLKSTNAAIASANSQLHVAVRDLTDLVRSFSDNLAAQNSSTLHAALYGVDRIHAALQSVCSLYTSKLSLERRLSNAPASLASTDDLINGALSKTVVAVQRLGQLLRQHEALLSGAAFAVRGMYGVPLCIQPLGAPADLVGQQGLLHKRGLRWMQLTNSLLSSVSHEEHERRGQVGVAPIATQTASSDRQQLLEQIAALKRELEQAKHEKEQLVLDTELLRIQVARRRQNAGDGTASSTSAGEGVTSPDGTTQNGLKPEELTREALIKEHYQARINQLSAQLHYSDSRAVAFFEECKALALKVQSMRSNRQQQADNLTVARKERLKDLAAASARVSQMEEELATVKRGYEEQLATMTDTLMSLNQQLADRQQVIDELSHGKKLPANVGRRR